LQLGIRPEYVETSADRHAGALDCTVTAVISTGQAQILGLQSGALNFKARVGEGADYQIGQAVWASFPQERVMLYDSGQLISARNN
jgi:ABC-type sugar transport system ATPase subunit